MAKKIKSVSEKYSAPQKVCKAWHTLNIGLEGMVAEEKYNKKFGAIQDYHLTWFGWHFRGGKKKMEELMVFAQGFKSGAAFVRKLAHDRESASLASSEIVDQEERKKFSNAHDWRTCDVDDCPKCQDLVDDGQIISCDNCYALGQSDAQGSWIEQEDGRVFCINCDTEKNSGGD